MLFYLWSAGNILCIFNNILNQILLSKVNIMGLFYTVINFFTYNILIILSIILVLTNNFNRNSVFFRVINYYLLSYFGKGFIKWPITLLFGYNIYHPALFYTVYILLLTQFISSRNKKNYSNRLCFIMMTLSLMLGMFWGSIHTSWGFFWSSDYIEYILLSTVLVLLFKIHLIFFKKNSPLPYYFITFILYILLLLRLNFFTTIHSFFQNFFLKNNSLFQNFLLFYIKISYYFFYMYLYYKLSLIFLFIFFSKFFNKFYIININYFLIIWHLIILTVIIKFTLNFYPYVVWLYNNFTHINVKFLLLTKNDLITSFSFIKTNKYLKLFNYLVYLTSSFLTNKYIIYLSLYYYIILWLISFIKIFKK